MQCSKVYAIAVDESPPSCTGLANDAAWTYNPNGNPNQPPASVTLTYDFLGYYGTWNCSMAGGSDVTVAEWKVVWNSVAGPTLRVRSTIIGSVTPLQNTPVRCRANANGNQVTQTQICPANVTTAVNLDVTATDATIGGVTFIDINHDFPVDGNWSLTGEVFVDCFTP